MELLVQDHLGEFPFHVRLEAKHSCGEALPALTVCRAEQSTAQQGSAQQGSPTHSTSSCAGAEPPPAEAVPPRAALTLDSLMRPEMCSICKGNGTAAALLGVRAAKAAPQGTDPHLAGSPQTHSLPQMLWPHPCPTLRLLPPAVCQWKRSGAQQVCRAPPTPPQQHIHGAPAGNPPALGRRAQ